MGEIFDLLNVLACTSIGPMGRPKLIRPRPECSAVVVTSMSHRLFGALKVENPVVRILQQFLAARKCRSADGGLLSIIIACRLVLGAHERLLPARFCAALLPTLLARGLHNILEVKRSSGSGQVPSAAAPLRMSDARSLLALVRTALRTKRVALPGCGVSDIERLAVLLVSAFMQSLPGHIHAASTFVEAETAREGGPASLRIARRLSGLRQMPLLGPHVHASELLPGVLIDSGCPLGAALPDVPPRQGLLVALYSANLEASLRGIDAGAHVTSLDRRSDSDEGSDLFIQNLGWRGGAWVWRL